MAKIRICVAMGIMALLGACGDDNKTDAPVSTPDAKTVDAPAGGPDGGGATTFSNLVLKASNEPSPCAGAGASATGTVTVTISADGSTIMVNGTYSGISGDGVHSGHIHYGGTTDNGPVVLSLGTLSGTSGTITKTLTSADYTNAGTGTPAAPATYAAFVTAMKAGMSYVNLHSTACTGGEIRVQIK